MSTLQKKILRRRFWRRFRVPFYIGAALLVIAIVVVAVRLTSQASNRDKLYEAGYVALNAGDYQAAYDNFAQIPGYMDAADWADTSQKLMALDAAIAEEDIPKAENLLGSIKSFPLKQKTQNYMAAVQNYLDGEYKAALPAFEKLSGFKKSDVYASKCNAELASLPLDALTQARDAIGRKDYDAAVQVLQGVTGDGAEALRKEAQYGKAVALFEAGNEDAALEIFVALGDYQDSPDYVQRINDASTKGMRVMLGGSGEEVIGGALMTLQGNILVCGSTTSSDGDFERNNGDYDGFAALISPDGRILWRHSYGSSGYDALTYPIETLDGGFVFTGVTTSYDANATTERGAEDVWLVKTDAHGKLLWSGTLGGSYSESGKTVASADGGLVVVGQTTSIDGEMEGSHGKRDGFIIKLNSAAAIEWQLMLGGAEDDGFQDVIALSDGYYCFGYTASEDGDLGEYPALGGTDNWAVKVSLAGEVIAQKRWGGSKDDAVQRAVPAELGGYLLLSHTRSGDTGAPNRRGGRDIWAQFMDAQMNPINQTLLGSSGDDNVQDAWAMPGGHYAVSGYAGAANGDFSGLAAAGHFLLELTPGCEHTLNTQFAQSGVSVFCAVTDKDGTPYYIGLTAQPVGDLVPHGNNDIYIERVD